MCAIYKKVDVQLQKKEYLTWFIDLVILEGEFVIIFRDFSQENSVKSRAAQSCKIYTPVVGLNNSVYIYVTHKLNPN